MPSLSLALCTWIAWWAITAATWCAEASPLSSGLEHLDHRRFREAQHDLAAACAAAPVGSLGWRQATYALATAWHHDPVATQDAADRATTLYRALWDTAPASTEGHHAALQLGRLAHLRDYYGDTPDLPTARAWYARVIAAAGHDMAASLATLFQAMAWTEELTPEGFAAADGTLTTWLTAHPEDPLAATLWMALADLRQMYRRDMAGAAAALRNVDRCGAPAAMRWSVVWRLGCLADEELHDRDLAVSCFRTIATRYLHSGHADEARQRLRDLGVEPPPLPLHRWDAPAEATP